MIRRCQSNKLKEASFEDTPSEHVLMEENNKLEKPIILACMGNSTSLNPPSASSIGNKMDFVVQFSRNWDGGEQERDVTMQTIQSVFPDANVAAQRTVILCCLCWYYIIDVRISDLLKLLWWCHVMMIWKKYSVVLSETCFGNIIGLEELH